ncbi:apotyrosinase chaperone MelC1 [Streptomyces mangrovisoli]|uniref:Tyrosinase n=1 Tax=Streptomyces mangrovisoli TaxID=1428628 RepID=A0A1J4NVR6_9ACTN|nr:tyrosinase cofactor [Streptomyces mangrovisoli]OIJ66551.1 tyrosinase [Streptomyces mangrovisoli]
MPDLSRRRALTAAAALATAAGAQAVLAPAAGAAPAADATPQAGVEPSPGAMPSADPHHGHGMPDMPEPFDEVYKGRRIAGRPTTMGTGHEHHGGYGVFVDGVALHVMRNADGTWISVVSHYDPVPTPRAAARAAVDELEGARLLPFPAN